MPSFTHRLDTDDIVTEQTYVSALYDRLDGLREAATRRLATALRSASGGTHQARSEREADVSRHSDQIAQLGAVEEGLCFGRLDLTPTTSPAISAGSASSTRRTTTSPCCSTGGHRRPGRSTWPPPPRRRASAGAGTSAPSTARSPGSTTRCSTWPVGQDPYEHAGLTSEAALLAALTAQPHRPDARHRRDHPGRTGPDDPVHTGRSAGRPGWPRHRQDGGGAAPGRVPALHPPRAAVDRGAY